MNSSWARRVIPDPAPGTYVYANGLASTGNESVCVFDGAGNLAASRMADSLMEAIALALEPLSGRTFVIDVGFSTLCPSR